MPVLEQLAASGAASSLHDLRFAFWTMWGISHECEFRRKDSDCGAPIAFRTENKPQALEILPKVSEFRNLFEFNLDPFSLGLR